MISAIAIILGIAAMILIHELGHFVVARALGIEVEEFSIGFGPSFFKRKKGATLYKVCAIPLGGYIKMKGEDPDKELTGSPDEFLSRKPHEKIAVALAGPLFNIILAMILLPMAYSVFGFRTLVPTERAVISRVLENSAADSAGLKRGHEIVSIEGEDSSGAEWAGEKLALSGGETLAMKIAANTLTYSLSIKPEKREDQLGNEYYEFGVNFAVNPVLGKQKKNSNAYKAGLREGDKLIEIEGNKVISFNDIYEHGTDGSDVKLVVLRNGKQKDFTISPVKDSTIKQNGKIRKVYKLDLLPKVTTERVGFFKGLALSVKEIGFDFSLIFLSLKAIAQDPGQAKNLGGPVAIAYIIHKSLEAGFGQYLRWISMISVNLCVVNLLPIIITDGGLILIFLFEAVSRRKMRRKEREVFGYIGWGVILALFVFILFNDIARFF